MIDLYNTLLNKRIVSFRAAMQNAQALNVVRLEASQMLSASDNGVRVSLSVLSPQGAKRSSVLIS
ncbi:MAG TPA: hypothetical protein HPP81_08865 [Deltaproteobacteria bacterium]|nr:hypothetical protein [Deltaproteobacteria bacterium]